MEILRHAVGLATDNAPRWLFFDAATDWPALDLGRSAVQTDPGLRVEAADGFDAPGFTGLLVGCLHAHG